MSVQAVLAPVFVQLILVFVLLYWTAWLRADAIRSGRVHPRDIALGEPGWPKQATQVGNAFRNQFELPVLFYVLTVLALATRQADLLFVVLAWMFVLARIAHAYIHVTSNRVMRRGAIYGVGALVLTAMWLIFMLRILLAPS